MKRDPHGDSWERFFLAGLRRAHFLHTLIEHFSGCASVVSVGIPSLAFIIITNEENYMMIKLFMVFLICTVFFCGCISTQAPEPAGFYAYGDSLTQAVGYADLNATGDDCYIVQMVQQHQPDKLVDHNLDGGGKTSVWGAENIAAHFPNDTRYFLIMFGTNDENLTQGTTAGALISMVNYAKTHGDIPVVLIPPLFRSYNINTTIENQTTRIMVMQKRLEAENIQFIKIYDAVDSIPNNGRLDSFNMTYYSNDGIHFNKTGHKVIGEYIYLTLFS